jgi:hypothetical protein
VKYNPPDVGYAETSSATERAIHIHPAPEISQHQTAEAEPPADKGYENVVIIVANKPLILTAKEKVDKYPNSLLNTGLYPNWDAS